MSDAAAAAYVSELLRDDVRRLHSLVAANPLERMVRFTLMQEYVCKVFRLTLIFQCKCGSVIVAHTFAAPHPARRPGACESSYYS